MTRMLTETPMFLLSQPVRNFETQNGISGLKSDTSVDGA